jgi:hypothetical protein
MMEGNRGDRIILFILIILMSRINIFKKVPPELECKIAYHIPKPLNGVKLNVTSCRKQNIFTAE